MIRRVVTAVVGLVGVGVLAVIPVACQAGGIGDPCVPEDEFNPNFAGFKVTEENIESRSFQCQTRICLVNHFQGRVTCPLGQPPPQYCNPTANDCSAGSRCVEVETPAPECDDNSECTAYGGACNTEGRYCQCQGTCPDPNQLCGDDGFCRTYVCQRERQGGGGECQTADGTTADNSLPADPNDPNSGRVPKSCCVPGTDVPTLQPVCGQCNSRTADDSVYCSCRCGPAEGEEDPNFNFCACPAGYTCSEIRKNVGLGDKQLTGKYCIKDGTEFLNQNDCGDVEGYFTSDQCRGLGVGIN